MDPLTIAVLSASIIVGLAGASLAGLKAWAGWLELKKMELNHIAADRGLPPASGRIEMADLKERIRKLEALGAGIDTYPAPRTSLPRSAASAGVRTPFRTASFFLRIAAYPPTS